MKPQTDEHEESQQKPKELPIDDDQEEPKVIRDFIVHIASASCLDGKLLST